MDQILIGGHSYTYVSAQKFTQKNVVATHPMEDGSEASDHLTIGSPSFDVTLVLFPGEYDLLKALSTSQQLISVVMPQGAYANVAVTNLTDATNKTANTTTATISLAVQKITSTKTVPTELDGIAIGSPGTATTALSVVDCPDDTTIEQLKEYYLSKLGPFTAGMERARMNGMTTAELLLYMTETQQSVYLDDQLASVEFATGTTRQALDLDEAIFTDGNIYYRTASFVWKNVSYTIGIRNESPDLGKYTFISTNMLLSSPLADQKHIVITRKIDMTEVYRGPMYDLTPIEMRDPKTGVILGTLQYSKYMKKIYIA